jgi:hypothetical protein
VTKVSGVLAVPSVLGSPPIAATSTLFQSMETFLQGNVNRALW